MANLGLTGLDRLIRTELEYRICEAIGNTDEKEVVLFRAMLLERWNAKFMRAKIGQ